MKNILKSLIYRTCEMQNPLTESIISGFNIIMENENTGNKIIGYHGTDKQFDKFKLGTAKSMVMLSEIDVERHAVFFAFDKEYAANFGKYVNAYELDLGKNLETATDSELAYIFRSMISCDEHGRWWWTDGYMSGELPGLTKGDETTPLKNTYWLKQFISDGAMFWQTLDEPEVVSKIKELGYTSAYVWEDDGVKTIAIIDLDKITKIQPSLNEAIEWKIPHKEGKSPIKTDIPPEKRTTKNLPRFADGKAKVTHKDWLCFQNIIGNSVAKGSDGKWYGWSHRAIHGFEIGDKVKKGDCAYTGKEYTIKTDDQAKQTAIDFAESVS